MKVCLSCRRNDRSPRYEKYCDKCGDNNLKDQWLVHILTIDGERRVVFAEMVESLDKEGEGTFVHEDSPELKEAVRHRRYNKKCRWCRSNRDHSTFHGICDKCVDAHDKNRRMVYVLERRSNREVFMPKTVELIAPELLSDEGIFVDIGSSDYNEAASNGIAYRTMMYFAMNPMRPMYKNLF